MPWIIMASMYILLDKWKKPLSNYYSNALHRAAICGKLEIAEFLVEHLVDANAVNRDGEWVLIFEQEIQKQFNV